MNLLITGASGFLGQYVIAEALRRGHRVRAVIRPISSVSRYSWYNHPNVEFARLDLRSKHGLKDALLGIDAVIHLAAAKSGDFYTQFAGTVVATENLLTTMAEVGSDRLIHISTFSVYDYWQTRAGSLVSEDSAIEHNPLMRDEYAQTKLLQETLVRDFEKTHNARVTILRPGMVYGRDNLWNACLGADLTDTLTLKIGGRAQLPLTYVENCATAILLATESEIAIGQTLNILDDNLPTQHQFAQKLIPILNNLPRMIAISWPLINSFTWLLWLYNQIFLQGKAQFPGIFTPARLHARFKPLRYTNARIKQVLQWTPTYSVEEAIDRSISDLDLLRISNSNLAITR